MARFEQPWTEADDAKLADLWHSGIIATAIAEELRRSKNSILGRRRRLGLPFRKEPLPRTKEYRRVIAPPLETPRHPCAACGVRYDRHAEFGCVRFREKVGVRL